MADDDFGSSTPAPPDPGLSGGMAPGALGAVRMAMSGASMPGQDALEDMANRPVIDPSNKWLHFAAASVAPTKGGNYSENFSNGLEALAGSQDREAELRAKYVPIIAAALMQRQTMAFQQMKLAQDMTTKWNGILNGVGIGLKSAGNDLNPQTLGPAVTSAAQQNGIPGQFVGQWINSLPKNPDGSLGDLNAHFTKMGVAQMPAADQLKAVTQTPGEVRTNNGVLTRNTNPTAAGGFGGQMAAPIPLGLSDADKLGKVTTGPAGPVVYDPLHPDRVAALGTPDAGNVVAPPGAPPMNSVNTQQTPDQKNFLDKYGTDFAQFKSGLESHIQTMADQNMRVQQMRSMMGAFRPGATADARMTAASFFKDMALNIPGVDPSTVNDLAGKFAGGDIGSMQAFKKLAMQGAMESLKAAMQNDTGGQAGKQTQMEFKVFAANSPSLNMDPSGIDNVQNFWADQYQKALKENQTVQSQLDKGTPLTQIRSKYLQADARANPPVRSTNGVQTPLGVDNHGGNIQLDPTSGQWVYK